MGYACRCATGIEEVELFTSSCSPGSRFTVTIIVWANLLIVHWLIIARTKSRCLYSWWEYRWVSHTLLPGCCYLARTRSFTGLIHVFMIPAGDTAFLSSVCISLVTGMHFFPLRAKGNSGGVISQMRIPSGNVGVNKADFDLALSLPATTLITINALYCIKKALKPGTHPLTLFVAATKTPPSLHSRVCEWVGGVRNRGMGYQVSGLISPTYRKNSKAVYGFQIYPLKKV